MIADYRYQRLQPLKDALAIINYPMQLLAETPASLSAWATQTFSTYTQLLEDNEALRKQNLELQGQMLRFKSLETANHELRDQLGASLRVGERVTLAEMTNVDLSPYRQQIWINKGKSAGVFTGQAVIDAYAVMGQVIDVTPYRSTVLLITDALHSIPVRILRTGLRTIAKGTGRIDNLELPFLPASADVRVGDLLVSSGLGGRYPADYPVARITNVGNDRGGAISVSATPLARLAEDKQVMLVWSLDDKLYAASIEEAVEADISAKTTPQQGEELPHEP